MYSVDDKLPESTGDKLPVREMDSNFPGEILIGLSWGNFELYWGSDSIGCFDRPPGNNLRSRLSGMLVKNVRILCWGILRSAGIPNFLKADNRFAWGECTDLLAHSLGN